MRSEAQDFHRRKEFKSDLSIRCLIETTIRRLVLICGLGLLYATVAAGQTAVATRNVNLRPDASTSGQPVSTLKAGDQVELLSPTATNGFLHVRTQNGEEGWAWQRNLHLQPAAEAAGRHVGPPNLYPNTALTPGKADTLDLSEITERYTQGCPHAKTSCTYSQSHRDVSRPLHKKVYDEYNVPSAQRNIRSGEVDHFYPLCAGGSNDISNLWYQPADTEWNGRNFGYHTKDKLESYVCTQIKNGKLGPSEAYDRMTKDWVKFYLDEGLDNTN